MIAPSARSVVVAAAAAALTATAALSQQVADLDERTRLKAHLKAECPLGGDRCEIPAAKRFYDALTAERLREAEAAKRGTVDSEKRTAVLKQDAAETGVRIAELQKGTAEIRTETGCMRILSEGVEGKRVTAEDVNRAFRHPEVTRNPCIAVERLPQLSRR